MISRVINTIIWLLVAGSVAIILGGLSGRPVLLAAVPTGSMVPVLNPGDMIPVVPYFGGTLELHDIIVFRTEKDTNWIVHRIVAGDNELGFATRGDANRQNDPYRVFPDDVVGTVPQIGTKALRIPRVGLLSLERSPLSNPLVAGVALIFGMYLIASDARAGLRVVRGSFRIGRLAQKRPSPRVTLGLYIGLVLATYVITAATQWTLGSEQVTKYRVVESKSTNIRLKDLYYLTQTKSENITFKNPSPLPLVVGLGSDDQDAVWDSEWFLLWPGSERQVALSITARSLGNHEVRLKQAVYLPFLPLDVIRALSATDWHLPIFMVSLVPVLVIVLVAASDDRVWTEMHHMKLALDLIARRG
ncbi:MAG TPA: signal peptidase I [Symbiobacteriaceae bacterium]|nr:signal peptidase I [Symbiobacteriaceae bacterium]